MNTFILKTEKGKGPFIWHFSVFFCGAGFCKTIPAQASKIQFFKAFFSIYFHIFAQIHQLYNNSECYKGNRSIGNNISDHFINRDMGLCLSIGKRYYLWNLMICESQGCIYVNKRTETLKWVCLLLITWVMGLQLERHTQSSEITGKRQNTSKRTDLWSTHGASTWLNHVTSSLSGCLPVFVSSSSRLNRFW